MKSMNDMIYMNGMKVMVLTYAMNHANVLNDMNDLNEAGQCVRRDGGTSP